MEDDESRLLLALGEITEADTAMEWVLRLAFCCLVSSKYAAVVAGGQSTAWLIEQCDALAEINKEITEENRRLMRAALSACKTASHQRNVLIHGEKAPLADGRVMTSLSKRRTHKPREDSWTLNSIEAVSDALRNAANELVTAIEGGLSLDVLVVADELDWELPPDRTHE
jgi:hypothetical protein